MFKEIKHGLKIMSGYMYVCIKITYRTGNNHQS